MPDVDAFDSGRRPPLPRARERAGVRGVARLLRVPLATIFLVLHLIWGMLAGLLLFPVLSRPARDAMVLQWSRVLLRIVGVRVQARGAPPAPDGEPTGALLVLNHVSWLDVFVVAALCPARFVAKADIARWPALGRFAKAVGTLFVERGRRQAVAEVNRAMAERLTAGQHIGIFPEGTTTDGSQLLQFHANLLQAAIDSGAPVVPVALRYHQGGTRSDAAAYVGEMNLAQSIWRILRAPRLGAELHWLPAIATPGQDRRALAHAAHAAIGEALALTLPRSAVEPAGTEPESPPETASATP